MLPVLKLLKKKEFVSVATSDLSCQPNAAPKMILDIDKEYIYIVDYNIGNTWENLKVNPRISISFSEIEDLRGYQINGRAKILEGDAISEDLLKKLDERKMSLSIDRVQRGVRNQKKHKVFELEISQKFIIYQIKAEQITEVGPTGEIKRQRIESAGSENF